MKRYPRSKTRIWINSEISLYLESLYASGVIFFVRRAKAKISATHSWFLSLVISWIIIMYVDSCIAQQRTLEYISLIHYSCIYEQFEHISISCWMGCFSFFKRVSVSLSRIKSGKIFELRDPRIELHLLTHKKF